MTLMPSQTRFDPPLVRVQPWPASRARTALRCALAFLLLGACTPAASGGSMTVGSPGELVLGADDEPEPPHPPRSGVRPCRVDEPSGCGTTPGGRTEVMTGQHYDVQVLAGDPVRGATQAPVTLVVFSDFQCPFCGRFEEVLAELHDRYPETLRIVWKDHPLPMHPYARPAALLARNAYARGGNDGFWQVHDRIFRDQADLEDGALELIAQDFALPWPPAEHVAPLVDACLEQAEELGIVATPTSFVNGRAVVGAQPVETFVELIDAELSR